MSSTWVSVATAVCDFTFNGIPSSTSTFTSSASDSSKDLALQISERAVLEAIETFALTQQSLLHKSVKITYDVSLSHEKLYDFSVYLNKYVGSFNRADEPYSDIPEIDVTKHIIYNDNGQSQLFSDPDLKQLTGTVLYADVSTDITFPGKEPNLLINFQNLYILEAGTIFANALVQNGTDELGYPKAGSVIDFAIVGGTGLFSGARGQSKMEVGDNNFSKITFHFQ